jgi:hypothetical protein
MALEFERDVLKHQSADLRDKLSKLQREFDDATIAMENMVPRCVRCKTMTILFQMQLVNLMIQIRYENKQ